MFDLTTLIKSTVNNEHLNSKLPQVLSFDLMQRKLLIHFIFLLICVMHYVFVRWILFVLQILFRALIAPLEQVRVSRGSEPRCGVSSHTPSIDVALCSQPHRHQTRKTTGQRL